MNVIIDDFYHSENITVIIKRASVATYCCACQRSVPLTLAGLLLPRPLPTPSPLPVGSVWASFTQVAVAAKQRLYQRLLVASPRQPLRVHAHGGECPYATACDVEECTSHSPVELRCGVGMSSWTLAWGLKESSWNKSCAYKGQLELQWQWRDWNITVPGTSYNWPWSSATPQELFLAHICVRPSILINRLKPLECINLTLSAKHRAQDCSLASGVCSWVCSCWPSHPSKC